MKEVEMRRVADWITHVLADPTDRTRIDEVRSEVRELCDAFPLYPELARV
jgi:glycine hydroxymethyltransferase